MKAVRNIVRIDEEKCNGCGECVPSCAEGALKIINGKAKLISDKFCDGLGACLGHCPMGAITVEQRPAEEYDEDAVQSHLSLSKSAAAAAAPAAAREHGHHDAHAGGGCPGSRMRVLQPRAIAAEFMSAAERPSQLGQWPVQLTLVPPRGRIWEDADVLIAADCVPFAYPAFHEKMLKGRTVAIACPKLDDVAPYVEKLAMIFAENSIRSITVAYMEVPCCTGILRVVEMALAQSGRSDIPLKSIVVGIDGGIQAGEEALVA